MSSKHSEECVWKIDRLAFEIFAFKVIPKRKQIFGIASFKASDAKQLEDALHKAFALNAPALVWVPHGDVPSPWDMIMMPKVRG